MKILNETFINSKTFDLLAHVLKYHYERGKTSISYQNFKELITFFVTSAMKSLLDSTNFFCDKCDCIIKKMPIGCEGSFFSKGNYNLIKISEETIKSLYLGNIEEMTVIFHELGHFKVKYELMSGLINIDLIRIVKEKAIEKALFYQTDMIIKSTDYYAGYYKTNYALNSEEKIVEINSIKLFDDFLKLIDVHMSIDEKIDLKARLKENQIQYQNFLRDFREEINFNSYWLDFEEAFDILIKDHPDWVMIPQLSIEYYLDDNGNVKKKTKKELMDMLKKELNPDRKQCIEDILDLENKKVLSKADFIDYDKINKMLNLKFVHNNNNNNNY